MDTEQPKNENIAGYKPTNQSPFTGNKKIIVALIACIVIIPLVLFLVYNFFIPKPSSEKLLATVGDKTIYKSTVERVAREQYARSAIDNAVLQRTLNMLIERAILDKEAQTAGVLVGAEETEERAKALFPSKKANITDGMRQTARYELLKEKIMAQFILSKDVYMISYWMGPQQASEEAQIRQQREDGIRVLNEAEVRFKTTEEPLAIAQNLHDKYPSLTNKLLFNTRPVRLFVSGNSSVSNTPYPYNLINTSGNTSAEYKAVAAMKPGEVRKIVDFGGSVIKVVSQNTGAYTSYENFIESKKKELVKIVTPL